MASNDELWKETRRDVNRAGRLALGWGVILTIVAVVLALAVGGILLAVKPWQSDRENEITRNSRQFEMSARTMVTQKMSDITRIDSELANLRANGGTEDQINAKVAQRTALVSLVCETAAQVDLDDLTNDGQTFVSANC